MTRKIERPKKYVNKLLNINRKEVEKVTSDELGEVLKNIRINKSSEKF